jgi:luciferase family oxidoreductase group 1
MDRSRDSERDVKSRVVTSRRSISKHRDRSEGLSVTIPLSILDLAPIRRGQTASDSFAASVALAQRAEELGYRRVWYAEHHNMATIASSATSVIIAHIAAHTRSIRLGAGGIMLPNHSPLTIAEQFGTLESLHPGRIDLGLGRAPGADRNTMRALRRDPRASDTFPDDVLELQAYLAGESLIPGVDAIPGNGTKVPLYILGSSLFGAQLAASLGLPYAFASHFAPDALQQAVALYRREFVPSAQLSQPYVIAGLNVVAADTRSEAEEQFLVARRNRVVSVLGRGSTFTEDEANALLASRPGQQVQQMLTYSAVGTPVEVRAYLESFVDHANADELIVALQSPGSKARLRSLELLAESSLQLDPIMPRGQSR